MKLKVDTTENEIYQQLMDLISIDEIKIEQKHLSNQGITTINTTPTIKISFNKHPMSWDFIHCCLLHPSDSFMKEMCLHQTLDILPKHCPKKINKDHVQYAT